MPTPGAFPLHHLIAVVRPRVLKLMKKKKKKEKRILLLFFFLFFLYKNITAKCGLPSLCCHTVVCLFICLFVFCLFFVVVVICYCCCQHSKFINKNVSMPKRAFGCRGQGIEISSWETGIRET
jgi:hypothetical protein